MTQVGFIPVLHVVWTVFDLSNEATKAVELNIVSVWSQVISVKCSILGYMPVCHSRACCGQAAIH